MQGHRPLASLLLCASLTAASACTPGGWSGATVPRMAAPPPATPRAPCDTTGFNTEEYRLIEENPLSTFAIDVDAASYSNVRRSSAGTGQAGRRCGQRTKTRRSPR